MSHTSLLTTLAASDAPMMRVDLGNPPSTLLNKLVADGILIATPVKTGKRGRPPMEYTLTEAGVAAATDPSFVMPDASVTTARAARAPRSTPASARAAARAAVTESSDEVSEIKTKTRRLPKLNASDTDDNGNTLTIESVRLVDKHRVATVSIGGSTFDVDDMHGSWAFNDPSRDGKRREVLSWAAFYLADNVPALAAKLTVEAPAETVNEAPVEALALAA